MGNDLKSQCEGLTKLNGLLEYIINYLICDQDLNKSKDDMSIKSMKSQIDYNSDLINQCLDNAFKINDILGGNNNE